MDIPPLLVNKYTGLALGLLINIFDIIILIIQIPFSDVEEILYGIITVVISTYIIDKMMLLGQNNIQVIVVSEKYEEIAESLMKDLDRGCTFLNITTGFMKMILKQSWLSLIVVNMRLSMILFKIWIQKLLKLQVKYIVSMVEDSHYRMLT